MSTALVVPTYQEAENIDRFLRAARRALPEAHIYVCDDNSPDGTGAIAEATGAELGDVEVLHRASKEGLGAAYRHGFRHALDRGHERIIQMDVDFSHDPAVLPALESAVIDGADVSVGSRYVPGGSTPDWSLHRRLLSRYGNEYARFVLRLKTRDSTAGFRCYRAGVLEHIEFETTRSNGYGFQIETGYRLSAANAEIVEIPIAFCDRTAGESKMSVRIMIETMLLVSWWGLCLRLPRLTGSFRRTPFGRRLADRTTPAA